MRSNQLTKRIFSAILSAILLSASLFVGMPAQAAGTGLPDDGLIPQNLHCPEEARTDTAVTLLWDKPAGIYELGDEFKTYVVYINGKALEVPDDIATMGYAVKNLTPNTEYEFAVKTKCADGTLSEAGNSITVRTKPASKLIDVTEFGAVGDGIAKDTHAIQAVIDACENGDTVWLPAGKTFLSGPLFLKSNMTFRVDGTLLGSLDLADYPVIDCMFEGRELNCYASLVTIGALNTTTYAYNAENITICGSGVINGRGFIDGVVPALVQIQRNGPNLNEHLGETDANRTRGRGIVIMNARNIYIRDLTVSYGPAWTVHAMFSDKITFDDVKFIAKNEKGRVTNGDGIDPESTSNMNVFNCFFRTGDDAIAIKSGKNLEGVTRNKPSYNIRVTDCLLDEAYGGFCIGSEMSGGVYNVLIQNCVVKGITSEALHVKSSSVRGGYVRDVVFKDCVIDGASAHFMLNGTWGGNNDTPPAPTPPVIENILCENVVGVNGTSGTLEIRGLAESPTRNITVKNCSFDGKGNAKISNAENLDFSYSTKINGTVAETDTNAVWEIQNCDLSTIMGIYPWHIVGRYGVIQDNGNVLFEGETAPKTYSPSVTASTATDGSASGGVYWQMNRNVAVGSFVEFELLGLPAGRYDVEYGYKRGGSRAIVQASIDGEAFAAPLDMYSGSSVMAHTTLGSTVFAEGSHTFKLEVIGKNNASSNYDVIVDYIKFIPLDIVAVESMTLDPDTLEMDLFDVAQLTATILPANATDRSITYTTSDASVAAVSGKGLVTAVSSGEAVITATSNNGGFVATCHVSVGPWNPKVGDSMIFEGETTPKTFSEGISVKVTNDTSASGGAYWEVSGGSALGNYVEFALQNLPAGLYEVIYGYKQYSPRGIVQISIDGTNIGNPIDQYAPSTGFTSQSAGMTALLGNSPHLLRIEVVGRNPSATSYNITVDYIKLIYNGPVPADAETTVLSATLENGTLTAQFAREDGTIPAVLDPAKLTAVLYLNGVADQTLTEFAYDETTGIATWVFTPYARTSVAQELYAIVRWAGVDQGSVVQSNTVALAAQKVMASIRVDESSIVDTPIAYTVSLSGMKNVLNVRVYFEVDGNMLDGRGVEVLHNEFSLMEIDGTAIRWTAKENNVWAGEFLLMYFGADGFTSEVPVDLAKVIYAARQLGSATMTLTGITVTGLDEDGKIDFLDSEIETASATTSVGKRYSIYDLNKDGFVDERDLAMVQRYYMVKEGDAGWAAAQVCDFRADGVIDMLDLIDLYLHFT